MQVTTNLVLTAQGGTTAQETSQAIPTQGHSEFAYTVLVLAASHDDVQVKAELEWSSDGENWDTVSGSSQFDTGFPGRLMSPGGTLQGAFVRFRYEVSRPTLTGSATIQSFLDLKSA